MSEPSHSPFVEVGDPGYGAGVDPADQSVAAVDTAVEGIAWAPLDPAPAPGGPIAFVDGVQQVEAWLTVAVPGEPGVVPGLACAVATGAVLTEPGHPARIEHLAVRRLVLLAGHRLLHLPGRGGHEWEPLAGAGLEPAALQRSVGAARQRLELALAEDLAGAERVVVLDGPLSHLREGAGAVIGAVKSHHRMYLEGAELEVVGALAVGQRTPLFAVGEDRYSWYQRLPVPEARGWAGILRGEVARHHGAARAAALADRATASLPAFAGRPHRDPRAPQNLSPIGGLEQRLRHRLGDRRLALRAVRRAAAAARLSGDAAAVSVSEPPEELAA
ncbi:MAG: hypothetical protein RIB67_04325 [Miltoncostaeaceae bacterium]